MGEHEGSASINSGKGNAEPSRSSVERFESALRAIESAPPFSKVQWVTRLLDSSRRLMREPAGVEYVSSIAPRIAASGIFADTDWNSPELLQPGMAPETLAGGDPGLVALELLSDLRLLAVVEGRDSAPGLSEEHARHHLTEVLALNLDYVFGRETETARAQGPLFPVICNVMRFIAESVGRDQLLERLVQEIWRLLRQRPVKVESIRAMITQVSVYCYDPETNVVPVPGAESLISALYGPTSACRTDPGVAEYEAFLPNMDDNQLQQEASTFARTMHDTGLVSPYHATFIRFLLAHRQGVIPQALGLSSTGIDGYLSYRSLVLELIDRMVFPETCQCIYGLACLLERGGLYPSSIAPSLWRQTKLILHEENRKLLANAFGESRPPEVYLLAGVISVLGQPLGIGQGNNPTCQSARAISLWAYSDPDYLLQLIAWAARDNEIVMHFEGERITSRDLPAGVAEVVHPDLDPVSLVLVPHLDRIYGQMGRMIDDEGEDPHRRINPEFHGWRVGRGFCIAVDVVSGNLKDYRDFVRRFYGSYHPFYNGGQPVIHPQPVGVAITDSFAAFVGWHAITILRCSLDQKGTMRVYFYNPNNDSGQDWGNGVKVSTEGNGELYGESSLPVAQFASRLYLFHFDPLEQGAPERVPDEEIESVVAMGVESWAAEKGGAQELAAHPGRTGS